MFQAAIFDMDGLLIDSERAIMHAWIDAAGSSGVTLRPQDYAAVIGLAEAESNAILTGLCGGPDRFASIRSHATERLSSVPDRTLYPLKSGATELLELLHALGVRCAVASSSSAAQIRQRLHQVNAMHHFAALAGGDEVPRGKPDPAVYQLAASRLGVRAAECVAFEDSDNGARAALASGAQVVLVPDLGIPSSSVAERSLHRLGTLHEAIEHVPRWFKPAAPRA